jgi:hypothetical protein
VPRASRSVEAVISGPTLYKARGVPTKQPVCAICLDRTRGRTTRLDLGHGVHVWLCAPHASLEFQTHRQDPTSSSPAPACGRPTDA